MYTIFYGKDQIVNIFSSAGLPFVLQILNTAVVIQKQLQTTQNHGYVQIKLGLQKQAASLI